MIDYREVLGKLGEEIVLNYLQHHGFDAKFSTNQFDRVRDIIVDGKNLEVKTMVPWVNQRCWTVRESQLNKLLNSDIVAFVTVGNDQIPTDHDNKVYYMPGSAMRIETKETRDGRKMLCIPFDMKGVRKLFDLSEEDSKRLKEASISGWNK